MKTFRTNIISLFAILLFTSCATQQRIVQTASGNPEITIDTQDAADVKARLVDAMTKIGFGIQEDTTYRLAFTKQMNGASGIFAQAALGNAYSTTPLEEISFNIVAIGSQVDVTANMNVSTQMAFGQTQRQDMSINANWFNDIEKLLMNIKQAVEDKTYTTELKQIYDENKGRVGIGFSGSGFVVQIITNSPAFKAGLRVNDRIIQIDGQSFGSNIVERAKQLTGKPGTPISLTIERNGRQVSIDAVRE